MAEKLDGGELWLPEEFLDEEFFLEESRAVADKLENNKLESLPANNKSSPSETTEMESDEEDFLAGLSRQMAQYSLHSERAPSVLNPKIMSSSPQSTLCDDGIWLASGRGSPNDPLQMSSPPSTKLEHKNNDSWFLFYEAAGEVVRMQQKRHRVPKRGFVNSPKTPYSSIESAGGFHNNPILTRQQLQAAQFYQLKRQHLIKQLFSAAWSKQDPGSLTRKDCLPQGVAPSGWPIVQRPQPGSGMRAVFLNNHGERRESAGTGVFLPRRPGTAQEDRRKSACSTVLLPAKVVQTLNLNVDAMGGVHPRFPGFYNEVASERVNPLLSSEGRRLNQTSLPPVCHELLLPPEWTY